MKGETILDLWVDQRIQFPEKLVEAGWDWCLVASGRSANLAGRIILIRLCTFDCGKVSVSCIQFAGIGGEEREDLVYVSSNSSSPEFRASVEIALEELFDVKTLSDSV